MVGHSYPVFARFRGGRSILTFAGGAAVFATVPFLVSIGLLLVTFAMTVVRRRRACRLRCVPDRAARHRRPVPNRSVRGADDLHRPALRHRRPRRPSERHGSGVASTAPGLAATPGDAAGDCHRGHGVGERARPVRRVVALVGPPGTARVPSLVRREHDIDHVASTAAAVGGSGAPGRARRPRDRTAGGGVGSTPGRASDRPHPSTRRRTTRTCARSSNSLASRNPTR